MSLNSWISVSYARDQPFEQQDATERDGLTLSHSALSLLAISSH